MLVRQKHVDVVPAVTFDVLMEASLRLKCERKLRRDFRAGHLFGGSDLPPGQTRDISACYAEHDRGLVVQVWEVSGLPTFGNLDSFDDVGDVAGVVGGVSHLCRSYKDDRCRGSVSVIYYMKRWHRVSARSTCCDDRENKIV